MDLIYTALSPALKALPFNCAFPFIFLYFIICFLNNLDHDIFCVVKLTRECI